MSKPVKIKFSAEQIRYLDSMFSEVSTSGQSYGELQFRAGQRNVLAFIKQQSDVEVQIVPVHRNLSR